MSKSTILARFRKNKKMDENANKDFVSPETNAVQPAEVNNVETSTAVDPTVTPKKNQVDPTFDCVPCEGEGLTFPNGWPEGKVCLDCAGTGKKNRGITE